MDLQQKHRIEVRHADTFAFVMLTDVILCWCMCCCAISLHIYILLVVICCSN